MVHREIHQQEFVIAVRDSLREAAKQLVALLGWSDMDLHTAYKNVEGWLGPVELLCLKAGSKDLELLLNLRSIQRVMGQAHQLQFLASMLLWVLFSLCRSTG